jgi:hypothetical protein
VGVVNAYVSATVSYAAAEAENNRRIGLSEQDKRRIVTPYIERTLAGGAYPNFARYFDEQVAVDPEHSFAFGLDCVLDGLAAQLTKRSTTAGQ